MVPLLSSARWVGPMLMNPAAHGYTDTHPRSMNDDADARETRRKTVRPSTAWVARAAVQGESAARRRPPSLVDGTRLLE
jgi:hypothetical protein